MKLFSRFFRKAPPAPPSLEERIAMLNAGSPDLILRMASGADEEGLRQAAQARLAQLIDEGSIDFAKFCSDPGNRSVIFSVAVLCKDAGRLPQALASIEDPVRVTQLVVHGSSSRLRQLAAQRVEDPVQLRQLLKQIRGKDKSVYKILKQKCDALNAEERKAAEIESEVNALCASLERHSHRTYDGLYASAFEQLTTRWRALTTQVDASVEQRAQQAIDRCREVIEGHRRQIAQQTALQVEEQAAHDARARAHQAAQQEAAARAGAEAQRQQQAAADREAAEIARAEKLAAEEQIFHEIGGLIRRANSALSDGHTQKAAGLRRAIEEKWPTASAVPTYLTRHLQQLDDKLSDLKQWKDYAVAPKRVELIEEMETLVGSTEEPKVLAERIKSLQQEWRTISKGIVSETPSDWERFQRASQAAYQPCREYFEAQAALRQHNLESRQELLERLTAFEAAENGESPDGRLLARVLREATQEWRQYFPVDREANRPAQESFEGAMRRLQAKLDAWHERNVADKQALVKRARHLLTYEDSHEAIEAVKQLQTLWKDTGPVPRDQDQALWSEFRELCDAVYQKRQQAFADYTAGLEAAKLEAVGLCEEAERVAALSGAAVFEAAARIPELRAAFEALDEMPRTEARGLQDRFERALKSCEAQIAQQQQRNAEESVTNLLEAGRHIRAYEWASVRNAESSERETLKQAAESFIASVQQWPKGGLQAVKEALARAGSMPDTDGAAGEKALRMLCIRGEISSEMPTPPEDEALRREYQVQRLMQGMGQGGQADWDSMLLEWIGIGAVSPAVHESLQTRFMRCRAKRPVRSPPRPTFLLGDGHDGRQGRGGRAGEMRRSAR